MRTFFSCFTLIIFSHQLFSQETTQPDTTTHPHANYWRAVRTPVVLIGTGLIAATHNDVFNKWDIKRMRDDISPHFKTKVDNYMVFVPAVAVFGLDAAGVKAKNSFINRTVLLVKSELVVDAVTFSIKYLTHVQRPDGSTDDSFPSGHTSHAFMAATFLHKEYGEDHPWISVLGYATASGVGVLRIMNNRHWISDVLVGAGIGMLSTNMIYATHQYKWGKGKWRSRASIFPIYGSGSGGLCLIVSLP